MGSTEPAFDASVTTPRAFIAGLLLSAPRPQAAVRRRRTGKGKFGDTETGTAAQPWDTF